MADDTRGEEFDPIYFEIDQNERGLFPTIVEKDIFEQENKTSRF